ncbi:MAG: glutamine synthetase [Planctomycetes bacterium]|jgi:glutamine synthetase|nr:glutamine synthetase [Planctomycetota bacterium]
MGTTKGMLSAEDLQEHVSAGEIDTVLVVFPDLYGRLMGKRFDAEFFLEEVLSHGGHACDYLLTVDMGMNPVAGYHFANWEKGYGDVHLVCDIQTLRRASWLDRTAMVLCDVAAREGEGLLDLAPRSILKRQAMRAQALGFRVCAASELEFYSYNTPYRAAAERGYAELEPTGWYIEDYHTLQGTREEALIGAARRHLRDSGVPVENSKGEWGLGQHEINVRYTDVVEMADRHCVYKQCLREVAMELGQSVTFMAKPDAGQSGSSCHIHMSLFCEEENAFAGDRELGPIRCSDVFRHFLGGWMAHTPDVMALYAPTVNSYKRYQAASWAPTRMAWSYDNRTAGFRVVGSGASLRIECRIPGADCNPYLAFAACLASGLDGIEKRIEPPAMFEGDVYAAKDQPVVPQSLAEAAALFESSVFTRATFGDDVVDHYSHFYRSEVAAFGCAVTDWERKRYFEQI